MAGIVRTGFCEQVPCICGKDIWAEHEAQPMQRLGRGTSWESLESCREVGRQGFMGHNGLWALFWGLGKSRENDFCIFFKLMSVLVGDDEGLARVIEVGASGSGWIQDMF